MELERKALYNLARMSWLETPHQEFEKWQVEDYRAMEIGDIFEELDKLEINLTRESFISQAEPYDNPEEFCDCLLESEDPVYNDRVYLLLFELWRRLMPDRPVLSIFCDELDHQINQYDRNESDNVEEIQNALGVLQEVLEDNSDEDDEEPHEVFQSIAQYCANDIESFLYDFIADRIDSGDLSSASELVEDFIKYVNDSTWFQFLRARLVAHLQPEDANEQIYEMINNPDLKLHPELLFDILNVLVLTGEVQLFLRVVRRLLPTIIVEEDFQDLLELVADFYSSLDMDGQEAVVQKIIEHRKGKDKKHPFSPEDSDGLLLINLMESTCSES